MTSAKHFQNPRSALCDVMKSSTSMCRCRRFPTDSRSSPRTAPAGSSSAAIRSQVYSHALEYAVARERVRAPKHLQPLQGLPRRPAPRYPRTVRSRESPCALPVRSAFRHPESLRCGELVSVRGESRTFREGLRPPAAVLDRSEHRFRCSLERIHQAAGAILRTIGTIATSAMMKAYLSKSAQVEAEHVHAVIGR